MNSVLFPLMYCTSFLGSSLNMVRILVALLYFLRTLGTFWSSGLLMALIISISSSFLRNDIASFSEVIYEVIPHNFFIDFFSTSIL